MNGKNRQGAPIYRTGIGRYGVKRMLKADLTQEAFMREVSDESATCAGIG